MSDRRDPPSRPPIERRLSDWAHRHLPAPAYEFLAFGLKMAWASLYAGIMLVLILATRWLWQPDWPMARYDFLTLAAVGTQILLLAFRLETLREAKVILIYHTVGTVMEIFKLKMGSWAYPEPGWLKLGGVPLFTGFMYACVGSFMVRAIRLFDMRFEPYPPFWMTALLAGAIYLTSSRTITFGHSLCPDGGNPAAVLANPHLLPARPSGALDALAAGSVPDVDLSLDCRECRDLDRDLALSRAEGLSARQPRQAWIVVSFAVSQLRPDHACASPAPARSLIRIKLPGLIPA